MAATLVTTLPNQDNLIFAGNLPHLQFSGVSTDDGMVFKLFFSDLPLSPVIILDETIFPDSDGNVSIKIRSVVHLAMQHEMPSSDLFVQSKAKRRLTISYDETTYNIYVIKGGLFIPESEYGSYDYNLFATTNLLSWMPADRKVKYREPVFLNYYNVQAGTQLYATAYRVNDTGTLEGTEFSLYVSLPQINTLFTIDVSFNKLMTASPFESGVIAFDLYMKNGSKITNTQRVTLINEFDEYDDVFAFSNSLGGFETIRMTGKRVANEQHSPIIYKDHDNKEIEYENKFLRSFSKSTGWFDGDAYRKWISEFYTSSFRFHMRVASDQFVFERILITSLDAKNSRFQINANTFEFRYANQIPWQLSTRETLTPPNPNDAYASEEIGDTPFSEFNDDFLNQTPLNQLTDELLNT